MWLQKHEIPSSLTILSESNMGGKGPRPAAWHLVEFSLELDTIFQKSSLIKAVFVNMQQNRSEPGFVVL